MIKRLSPIAQKVVTLRLAHPDELTSSIAKEAGCSREYVRQVLGAANLRTRQPLKTKDCPQCNKPFPHYNNRKYCSPECRHAAHFITIQCEICGKTRELPRSWFIWKKKHGRQHDFCSRKCLGIYAGRHYGWGNLQRKKASLLGLVEELRQQILKLPYGGEHAQGNN